MRNLFAMMLLEAMMVELMSNAVVVVAVELPDVEGDNGDIDCGTINPTEDELAEWLKSMGLTPKESIEDYAPTERMVAMSVDELATLKREFDVLKVRADEGEELARKVRALHEEFFPTDNE